MMQNNRYIRLKTLIVGYTLPQIWTRKVKLEKVRVYFSGNDLWEATSIRDGFDPENGSSLQQQWIPVCTYLVVRSEHHFIVAMEN